MTVEKTPPPGGGSHREAFARNAPNHTDALVLVANINRTYSVPADARVVIFSATGDFFAKAGGAAAVPTVAVTDGSAAELNPTQWNVEGVVSIGVIASAATTVTLSVYL